MSNLFRSEPSPGTKTGGTLLSNQARKLLITFQHLVEGGGFEPPKLSRQIYSLIPLATREPLQKRAYILFTAQPLVNLFSSDL